MYRKNVAGQHVGFLLVDTTGAAAPGLTVTAYRSIDGGAQAAATGTATSLGNGQYDFALSQADTNGNNISLLFTATGAVPVEKTIVTTAANPTSGTNFGLTALPTANPGASGGLPTLDASLHVASDAKAINSVSTSSVTTINANIGTTQPMNFTGTGASALVKSDMVDIAGAAVSTSTAQIGVNLVQWNGTAAAGTIPPDAMFLRSGTAQAGGASTITLDAGASATNNLYQNQIVFLRSGTGAGQSAIITSYNGTTKVATIVGSWATNPDATSVFTILPFGSITTTVSGGVNVTEWNGVAVATPNVAGVPIVDLGYAVGHAVTVDVNNALNVSTKYVGGTLQTANDLGAALPSGHAPGAANGLMINGANTGPASWTGGWSITNSSGDAFAITSTAGVGFYGLKAVGYTAGIFGFSNSAINGSGIVGQGANAGGSGIVATAGQAGNWDGFRSTGVGTGDGIHAQGGATGNGVHGMGGLTSGEGFRAEAQAGNSSGIHAIGQGTGVSLQCDQGITGNLSGSVGSVVAGVTVSSPTAAQIATAIFTDTTASDFTTAGSPGKILVGQLGGTFTTNTSSVFSTAALANAPSGGGGSSTALHTGTCQAGSTSTTIKLDSGASATDNTYQDCTVALTGGTGAGQSAVIASGGYVGATKIATITTTWATTPDATTTFAIYPLGGVVAAALPNPAPSGYGNSGGGTTTVTQSSGGTNRNPADMTVQTSGGSPIAGATVSAYFTSAYALNPATAPLIAETVTDNSGHWSLSLPSGANYTLVFAYPSDQSAIGTVTA